MIEQLARRGASTRNLFLVLLGLVSWWLAERFSPPQETGKKLQPGKVDYYSKSMKRTVMNELGEPKELLFTDELTHFDKEDRSELTKPIMTLYVKEGPPWVIHSETATIPGTGNMVYLNGNVLVLRDANKDGRTMRIETRNVIAQPDQDYAETAEDINVSSPPDYMTGTGAKFKFGDSIEYTVLANVRRRHDIQK